MVACYKEERENFSLEKQNQWNETSPSPGKACQDSTP